MDIKQLLGAATLEPSVVGKMLQRLESNLQVTVSSDVGGRVFSNESIDDQSAVVLGNAVSAFDQQFSQAIAEVNGPGTVIKSIESIAAAQGFLAASGLPGFMKREAVTTQHPILPKGSSFVSGESCPDYVGERVHSIEAFDNRESRQAVLYTATMNYAVTQQDEFNALIWPMIVLGADQVGFGVSVNRFVVHSGARHSVDGSVLALKKIDLVRALADSTVLHKERTRLRPVARAASKDKLIDETIVAPKLFEKEDQSFMTAPYRTGVEINILGISQTDAQLAARGNRDFTDAVDPAIMLEALYISDGTMGGIMLDCSNTFGNNFVAAPQGQERDRQLNMNGAIFFLNKDTTLADGAALPAPLDVLKSKELTARVAVSVSGVHNSEYGTTMVNHTRLELKGVTDKNRVQLSESDADYIALKNAINAMSTMGFDARAFTVNSNLRENGQYIDTTSFLQMYEVPLLAPVTALKPIAGAANPNADLDALVATTKTRMANDGVTAVLQAIDTLERFYKESQANPDNTNRPEILGAARFLVQPTFINGGDFDLTKMVDSLTSDDRFNNIASAIANVNRELAIRLQKMSEYKSALISMGYDASKLTVLIACDSRIAPYIMKDGELRTLGQGIETRVVSTLDTRFNDRVFLTFGQLSDDRNNSVNLLNFGNCIWSPEVVYQAPITREGRTTLETIVQPRYRFVMHLPVAATYTITGFREAVESKLPINFHNV